jgi:hypothetical protein
LNSLLDIPELLPSGHERAATAVSCQVSWNHDKRPDYQCCCNVFFRSAEDVKAELKNTMVAIKELQEIEEADYRSEDKRAADRVEPATIAKEGLARIGDVWHIPVAKVESMALECADEDAMDAVAQTILQSNPCVVEFLRLGCKEFHGSDHESMAKQIKPFLDSTEVKHAGSDSVKFAACP